MKKFLTTLMIVLASSICLCGCNIESDSSGTRGMPIANDVEVVSELSSDSTIDLLETTSTTTETTTTTTTTEITTTTTTTIKVELSAPPFSLSDVPAYSGKPYVEVNQNKPFFTEYPDQPFELYSPLDSLGRCGVAYANITPDIMPTTERTEISMISPSGWHTAEYGTLIEDSFLYNRCHIIGYQLAGENDNECNLITGTRYMNVEGMEPFENRVTNYVESYHGHVLYRVTPVFEGNNLLASGVLMEAYSINDNGKGIQFCVFCYNVQPQISINYADGESWTLVGTESNQAEIDRGIPVQNDAVSYVLNTNTHKFHYPSCPSVDDMKDKNKDYYTGSRDEVIAKGYVPCKRCNP